MNKRFHHWSNLLHLLLSESKNEEFILRLLFLWNGRFGQLIFKRKGDEGAWEYRFLSMDSVEMMFWKNLSPFCSLIPLCTTTCSAQSIDFWHNWCLFAPFIQDCHCKPIVRLVMMELYSLKRNSRRLLQHNHKLLARPTCSNSYPYQTIVKQNSLDGVLYKNSTNPNLAWLKCNKVRRKSDHLQIL